MRKRSAWYQQTEITAHGISKNNINVKDQQRLSTAAAATTTTGGSSPSLFLVQRQHAK